MSNLVKRSNVLQEINQILTNQGFETSNIYDRSCFDMVARKELLLLILKVLINIDSINKIQAEEIKTISHSFHGSPLIVGVKSKNEYLEEDVVYERHGIPIIGRDTLKNILIDNEYPEILADRGGYYVKINGDILQEARQEYNLSLKDLADLAHVSRETIYKYEHGIVKACPETAMILEDILNLKITLDINLFEPTTVTYENSNFNDEDTNLSDLGFGVISTKRTPFDALATQKPKDTNTVITNMERNRNQRTLKKMAISLNDLSLITGSDSVFILNNDKIKESLDGIPVVKSWEMKEIETPAEFIKIIKERKQ